MFDRPNKGTTMDNSLSNYASPNASLARQINSVNAPSMPNTAAQDALNSIEGLGAYASELRNRLSAIAANLGVSLPPTAAQEKPRAVRSGIIGSIHAGAEDTRDVINSCHNYLEQIERQV